MENNVNHSKWRKYSRQTQKLVYWLINDYACHLKGIEPTNKVGSYHTYLAKKELKQLYLKQSEVKINNLKPFKNFKDKLQVKILDVLKMDITDDNKVDIIINDIEVILRKEFQLLVLTLDGTFSLSLNLMSQKQANRFVDWMFNMFLDNDIAMRKEIVNLYKESDNDRFIYAMLRKKKCCICGDVAELHHEERVNNLGGYSKDYGQGIYLPLCRVCHTKAHHTSVKEFNNRYMIKGIRLNEEQAIELSKVYKNQFKGLKEEIDD